MTILGTKTGQKSVSNGAKMSNRRSDITRAGINVENCNFIPNSWCCKVKITQPIWLSGGRALQLALTPHQINVQDLLFIY